MNARAPPFAVAIAVEGIEPRSAISEMKHTLSTTPPFLTPTEMITGRGVSAGVVAGVGLGVCVGVGSGVGLVWVQVLVWRGEGPGILEDHAYLHAATTYAPC